MSCNYRVLLYMGVMLVCFTATAIAANDTSRFAVDSYIPERFADLEWQVDGDFGFSGRRLDRDGRNGSVRGYEQLRDKDDSDLRRVRCGSRLGYDWVTIPRYFSADLDFSGYLSSSSWDTYLDRTETDGDIDYNRYETRRTGYDVAIGPSLSAGQYLLGDLEVAGAMLYTYSYGGVMRNESYSYDSAVITDTATGYVQAITRETWTERDKDDKSHRLTAEFTPGWGRLYEGRYAATTMNMVEELREAGFLVREPGYDEMLELTEIVYQYRLKHAIDARLLRIEALEAVIAFLYDCGAITDPGPHGHLVIEDVWDYFDGRRNSRPFGFKLSGGVSLDYTRYSYQEGDTETRSYFNTQYHPDSAGVIDTLLNERTVTPHSYNSKHTESLPSVVARVQYSRPLDLNWQLNCVARGDFYFDAYKSYTYNDLTRRTDFADYYSVVVSAGLEYFHDARTSIAVLADYVRTSQDELERETQDGVPTGPPEIGREDTWALDLQARATYRISIPTTITANLLWKKRHEDWGPFFDYDRSSYELSLGITHYVF